MTASERKEAVRRQVETGLTELEALLANKASITAAQAALADRKLPAGEFAVAIPSGVLQILVALRNPGAFEQIRADSSPEVQGRMDVLREKALTLLRGVESHPVVVRQLAETARRTTASTGSDNDFKLNTINSISWMPLWAHNDEGITPMVRISLLDESNRQLLDTTLNLDGLTYVASTLLMVLGDELERTTSLRNNVPLSPAVVDLPSEERLEKLRASLKRVEAVWGGTPPPPTGI